MTPTQRVLSRDLLLSLKEHWAWSRAEQRLHSVLWSITSKSCLQGQGRRDLMAESYHLHRCTEVTYHLGCYGTLLLGNLPPLQDWISHITRISQRCADGERKKKKLHRKCFILVMTMLLLAKSPISHHCLCYSSHAVTAECNETRLGWRGGSGCAPRCYFLASYYPKRQTGFAESPLPWVRHTGKGGWGTPLPFIELVSIQIKIIRSIQSHAPGRKMIADRSRRRIFPHSQ